MHRFDSASIVQIRVVLLTMARPASLSDPKPLAKLFRCHYKQMDCNVFAEDFEPCLEKHTEFFLDLWQHDKYAAESKLQASLKLVWPKMDISLGKQIAKSVKSVLSSIHYKKARMSSGQKSPRLQMLLERLSQESQQHKPQLPVMSSKRIGKATTEAPIKKHCSSSSTAALYGVCSSSGSKDPLLQISVPNSEDIPLSQAITILDSQDAASNGFYFDHNQRCLVKVSVAGDGQKVTAMSKMRPGADGFAEAVFDDGDVQPTEFPNLELFGGLKRPAAAPKVLKKPSSSADQDEEEAAGEESSSDDGPADEKKGDGEASSKGLPSKHIFEDGTVLKLSKFTGQSYITYKEPGKDKFTLLVACSEKQAARDGKKHPEVMDSVWAFVVSCSSLPSKGECKKQILDLLSQ